MISATRILKTSLNIPADYPRYAQIAVTNLCNLDCTMCFKHFVKLDYKHMDIGLFKSVVDKLKGVHNISLCGYGEPLLHPEIYVAIEYCKNNGFETQLTSNGLTLNSDKKIKDLIASGLDLITFSMESINEVNEIGHPNQSAVKNIKRLVELKNESGSKTPAITLQTLMIKDREEDIYEIIEWGALNGIDRINVARFEKHNTLTDIERPNIQEEKVIFKKFKQYRKKYNIRIDCLQDMMYTGLNGILYKNFKRFLGMDKHCIRLHDFVFINVEGHVNPCCALVDYKMGNLCDEDLSQIWKNKKYNNFRTNYSKVPWCSGCDFARLKQIESN